MSPPDENERSGSSGLPARDVVGDPGPSDGPEVHPGGVNDPRREFKTFDRAGMPEAKRLKDPEMRGRVKRSQENRSRRKRRQRFQRWVLIPGAVVLVFAILIGMTLYNNAKSQSGKPRKDESAGDDAPKAATTKTKAKPPVVAGKTVPDGEVLSARDRFLLRTEVPEPEAEISEQGKNALRAAGLPTGEGEEAEDEEISEEEKMRLLRKAAPYSRTVREEQQKRDISPDDLYLPEVKPAQ